MKKIMTILFIIILLGLGLVFGCRALFLNNRTISNSTALQELNLQYFKI